MKEKSHLYEVDIEWTGNRGSGTSSYTGYSRDHEVRSGNKSTIYASSDPSFRGDAARYNPEELFVASLSQCHMLWFLHLCSADGIIVKKYHDHAIGIMKESLDGGGHFTEVTLRPEVTIASSHDVEQIDRIHSKANRLCFIANSCNFNVNHKGKVIVE
ncbi:MAG: OsmC family protein [Saprospiraceae bacterium]|nr:OsmC family protein [Saprospiraceae bacterium]